MERAFNEPSPFRQRDDTDTAPPHIRQARDAGLRTIERHKRDLSPAAGDRLESLVRVRDQGAVAARYLDAVGNPHYRTAFGKLAMDP